LEVQPINLLLQLQSIGSTTNKLTTTITIMLFNLYSLFVVGDDVGLGEIGDVGIWVGKGVGVVGVGVGQGVGGRVGALVWGLLAQVSVPTVVHSKL
jgi:hypothetical protein